MGLLHKNKNLYKSISWLEIIGVCPVLLEKKSLYMTVNTFCSSFTHQLALIYKPLVETKDKDGEEVEPELAVMISDVQQQKGMADCGLFSVAFALHLALGDDPSCLLFEQSPHLIRYNYCSSSYMANNP